MVKRGFPESFIAAEKVEDEGELTVSEIIAIAWDDNTSFDEIKAQSGLAEKDIIKIMRTHMQPSSFRLWRKRVTGRTSKHSVKATKD
ncbi:MAG: TIGR03643 family protein [Acidimicrobiales bacterium]|nr:TIGR03643 family protein [Hyphomonadaceae bacterium]RZV44958.1 MAG: TIGR03643 family protein [Acidimicrobiales bacterium]